MDEQHLYRNNGDGTFTDVSNASHLTETPRSNAGAWGDYDNDGHLDLFVSGHDANLLYHNNGDGTFTRVTSGSVVNDAAIYNEDYSCAWGDYDNDGFLDLVVGSINGGNPAPNFLYRNNGNANHWLKVRCIGTVSNRAAIGAKVRVRATIHGKTFWQLREISGGDGYGGQNLIAHFGLGDATVVEQVRVEWPSGRVSEWMNVAAGQFLTLVEPGEPPSLAVARTGSQLELTVHGYRGVPYALERSTDLKTWSVVTNLPIRDVNGTAVHQEPLIEAVAAGFFRAYAVGP